MVVLIHAFAQLPEAWWYMKDSRSELMLALDQISRISVPLFLFSSWYGLAKKFQGKSLSVAGFLKSRVFKLLPLYLLWSGGLWIALNVVAWGEYLPGLPAWKRLLFGQSDYHLYFVPLLIIFYIGFLFTNRLSTKLVTILAPLVLVIQIWWFGFYSTHSEILWFSFLPADQAKYIWPLSWIWYVWLGLVLARNKRMSDLLKHPIVLLLIAGAVFFFADRAIDMTTSQVVQGYNVLPSSQFTRTSVVWYVSFALLFLVGWGQRYSLPLGKFWEWFGRNSYLIYLSHTLVLRLFVSHFYNNPLAASQWLLGFGILIGLLLASHTLNKMRIA